MIAQAIDEHAEAFHERFGFRPFRERGPEMLAIRMSGIAGLSDA